MATQCLTTMQNFKSVEEVKSSAPLSSIENFAESSKGEFRNDQDGILEPKRMENSDKVTSVEVAGSEDNSQYHSGLGFVITCIAICFAIFLVALVRLSNSST